MRLVSRRRWTLFRKAMRGKTAIFISSGVYLLLGLSSLAVGGDGMLTEYWKRPVPAERCETGSSLYPEDCGRCHEAQYVSWTGSLHSRAVGPGLLGQLRPSKDPESVISCYLCHAPMSVQSEVAWYESPPAYSENPSFDNKLKLSGVSCAVCHVRDCAVHGPPLREGVQAKVTTADKEKPHGGFAVRGFFQSSEFCAACHQLDNGYELNGKALTNTYREWWQSVYGKSGAACQSCHMPDRKHLWRGIHDRDMVLSGLTIETERRRKGAGLLITNTGVGHFFPTYVTPLVVVKGFLVDKKGRFIPSSLKNGYIGRKVSLDLEKELFDTRIPPLGKYEFDYKSAGSSKGAKVVFEIWVYPDKFYNRFYKSRLRSGSKDIDRNELKKAVRTTNISGYRLYRTEVLL